jgi:hypothetical protein
MKNFEFDVEPNWSSIVLRFLPAPAHDRAPDLGSGDAGRKEQEQEQDQE